MMIYFDLLRANDSRRVNGGRLLLKSINVDIQAADESFSDFSRS